MRRFEKGDRFWSIERSDQWNKIRHGKIGHEGRTLMRTLPDESHVIADYRKSIERKLKEGYKETTPSLWPLASPTGRALEDALAEDPDDLANHMAYADWLSEQSDERLQKRAEFIRVQLALEDETLKPGQRKKLKRQETDLLEAHQRDWLGLELADYLLDRRSDDLDYPPEYPSVRGLFTFRRGWLDSLTIGDLSPGLSGALATSPAARLLRTLVLEGSTLRASAYVPLQRAKVLGNLRSVTITETGTEDGVVGWLKNQTRLRALHLSALDLEIETLFRNKFPHLEVLHLESAAEYPLKDIAANASLGKLRKLVLIPDLIVFDDDPPLIRVHDLRALVESPHLTSLEELTVMRTDAGDAGVRAIIASGILKRLTLLNLDHGCITDAGAQLLAECPDLKHLKELHLTDNRLTRQGRAVLQKRGPKVFLDEQQEPNEDGEYSNEYSHDIDDDFDDDFE